jgi:hypothetical protein
MRLQFQLRTMLVAVAVIAIGFAGISYWVSLRPVEKAFLALMPGSFLWPVLAYGSLLYLCRDRHRDDVETPD